MYAVYVVSVLLLVLGMACNLERVPEAETKLAAKQAGTGLDDGVEEVMQSCSKILEAVERDADGDIPSKTIGGRFAQAGISPVVGAQDVVFRVKGSSAIVQLYQKAMDAFDASGCFCCVRLANGKHAIAAKSEGGDCSTGKLFDFTDDTYIGIQDRDVALQVASRTLGKNQFGNTTMPSKDVFFVNLDDCKVIDRKDTESLKKEFGEKNAKMFEGERETNEADIARYQE